MIGEIKANASDLEMMMMRAKIASAILDMQETEKTPPIVRAPLGECFIEVTKVSNGRMIAVRIALHAFQYPL